MGEGKEVRGRGFTFKHIQGVCVCMCVCVCVCVCVYQQCSARMQKDIHVYAHTHVQ